MIPFSTQLNIFLQKITHKKLDFCGIHKMPKVWMRNKEQKCISKRKLSPPTPQASTSLFWTLLKFNIKTKFGVLKSGARWWWVSQEKSSKVSHYQLNIPTTRHIQPRPSSGGCGHRGSDSEERGVDIGSEKAKKGKGRHQRFTRCRMLLTSKGALLLEITLAENCLLCSNPAKWSNLLKMSFTEDCALPNYFC